MTAEQAYKFYEAGNTIAAYLTDGITVTGFCCMFIPYYDNDPEIDEIVLETTSGLVSIPVSDIKSIDIIS